MENQHYGQTICVALTLPVLSNPFVVRAFKKINPSMKWKCPVHTLDVASIIHTWTFCPIIPRWSFLMDENDLFKHDNVKIFTSQMFWVIIKAKRVFLENTIYKPHMLFFCGPKPFIFLGIGEWHWCSCYELYYCYMRMSVYAEITWRQSRLNNFGMSREKKELTLKYSSGHMQYFSF